MKQRLFTIFLILALVLTMAGCSAAGAARTLDAAGDRIEDKLDTVEDTVEYAVRGAVPPDPAETSAGVTKEEAQKIALDYAGFTADQVQRLHTEYEIDNGIPQYDVEFHQGDWEYEFEIGAETGTIISFDKDHKYD